MTRTAIIAALPGELKPLTRGWRHQRTNGVDLWHKQLDDSSEWIAACAGAGVAAATRACAEAEKLGPLTSVISTGWAGALREDFAPGHAFPVSGVIDARTGERFRPGIWSEERWLVTSPRVADHAEKQRLAETYQAALVDMEASAIARFAQMRGIPFYCIKGISDGYTDQLPDFNRFISPSGRFLLIRFLLFVLFRPWHWPALIRMGENSSKAARALAESLLDILEERGQKTEHNGDPNHPG